MLGIFFCREDNFKPKNYAEIWYPEKEGWYVYMIRNLSMRRIIEHSDTKSRKWHPRSLGARNFVRKSFPRTFLVPVPIVDAGSVSRVPSVLSPTCSSVFPTLTASSFLCLLWRSPPGILECIILPRTTFLGVFPFFRLWRNNSR
jgi:hypothetical protein